MVSMSKPRNDLLQHHGWNMFSNFSTLVHVLRRNTKLKESAGIICSLPKTDRVNLLDLYGDQANGLHE